MTKGTPVRGAKRVKPKNPKSRKASSNKWLERQLNDPFVRAAKTKGYRSRAAFKLSALDDKFHFLRPGSRILDLGAAPQLERYQRWRRFDSAFSAAVMDGLNRLFSNDSAPLRTLRDLGLGLVDRVPPLKRFLAREAGGGTGTVPALLSGERL